VIAQKWLCTPDDEIAEANLIANVFAQVLVQEDGRQKKKLLMQIAAQ
jgi:hypothetical protein